MITKKIAASAPSRLPRLASSAVLAMAVALSMSGCASVGALFRGGQASSDSGALARPAATSVDAGYDFDWTVRGDTAIRPVQVFSDAGHTYIQMRAGQMIPEVIVDGAPVPFSISPPNLIVSGDPSVIDLVSDGYRAVLVNGSPTVPQVPVNPARVRFVDMGPDGQLTAPEAMRRVDNAKVQPPASAPAMVPRSASPSVETTWYVSSGDRLLSHALVDLLAQHGKTLEWHTRVDLPVLRTFGVRANDSLTAIAKILALASNTTGYRFFFSIRGDTYIVTAQKA
jgi:uncharacterized protein YceK